MWESSCLCLFYKDFAKFEIFFFFILLKFRNSHVQGITVFSEKIFDCFWNKISKVLGHIKSRFVFWLKINFGKMASDEHIDLRNIENIVRDKYYPEDISKD